MIGKIYSIPNHVALNFLMPRHYAGRKPSISHAFGWVINERLVAVCTFGKPASPSLCDGVCGKEWSSNVYELNRLCRASDLKQQLSQFVSACLRRLEVESLIIVSYADTAMNHAGYIYQACNFLYTGMTKERTDMFGEDGKHSRHSNAVEGIRKVRSSKHRYIFFCAPNRRVKKKMLSSLKYNIEQYPKSQNSNYENGFILKDSVVVENDSFVPMARDQLDMEFEKCC